MAEKVIYDFDVVVSRDGTHAEKYVARKRLFGTADVEPFWVADMDLVSPSFLVDELRARLDHAMFGYTENYDQVYDAICWWMKDQHGAEIEREWILLSPSVVTSISLAVQTMTDPGESVVLLSPVYGPFFSCTEVNGREVVSCPLRVEQGRFEIDFSTLEETVARQEVALFLLCNPQNPGGRVWSEAELTQVAEICAAYGITLFSDEIHSDIVFPPHRNTSALNVPAARDITIVAHSIGKTFNTSGLQASFVIIPDADLRSRFQAGFDRSHAGGVNLLGKVALAAALSPAGVDYKQQLVAYLHENTRQVCAKLEALNRAEAMVPEATYLVWCDFRKYGPWADVFKRLIDDAQVGLAGGTFFGPGGDGWFRINCAHPRPQLMPAIDRIVATFKQL